MLLFVEKLHGIAPPGGLSWRAVSKEVCIRRWKWYISCIEHRVSRLNQTTLEMMQLLLFDIQFGLSVLVWLYSLVRMLKVWLKVMLVVEFCLKYNLFSFLAVLMRRKIALVWLHEFVVILKVRLKELSMMEIVLSINVSFLHCVNEEKITFV